MSTTHRVLSPSAGSGARFSIPFFQGVSYDAQFGAMQVPAHVRKLRSDLLEAQNGRRDDVEFTFKAGRWQHLGEATLMNRIKSHPDVGERWYPVLLEQIRNEQRAKAEKDQGQDQDQDQQTQLLPNAADESSSSSNNQAIEAH